MAKKLRKKPVRLKKDNAGCMSGLISMFHFRQGRFTQRLLSDKSCGSGSLGGTVYSRSKIDLRSDLEEKHNVVYNNDIKKVEMVTSGQASVESLMAKEMSGLSTSENILRTRVEQLRSELGLEADLEKNQKKTQKKTNDAYKVGSDHFSVTSRATQSTWSDPSESSSFDINLTELMLEFRSKNPKYQDKHVESICNKKDNFLRLLDSEHITSHYAIQNKEAFLKLLQSSDPLLMQHIPDLQNAQTGDLLDGDKLEESADSQVSHKPNRHHFFRKKERPDGSKPSSESSEELKRIVVLKPTPIQHQRYPNTAGPISSPKSYHNLQRNERVPSHFSLKEIRRRLRSVIGEGRRDHHLAMDGVLDKVPYGFRKGDENAKTSTGSKQNPKLSTFIKIGNTNSNLREYQPQKVEKPDIAHSPYRGSVFYEEARKHLAEMISSGGRTEISSRQVSKQLGRILSIPGYNSLSPGLSPGYNSLSPRLSPGREKEMDSPRLMKVSSLRKIKVDDSTTMNNPSTLSTEILSCSDGKLLDIEEDISSAGNTRTEECGRLNVQEEISTSDLVCIRERCDEEEPPTISDPEQPMSPCIPISPISSFTQKIESSEKVADSIDRPSPVSVLEPLFTEEIITPENTETTHAGLRVDPRHLTFEEEISDSPLILTSTNTYMDEKEMKFTYVRSVLEASGLNCNKFPERWLYSDEQPPLDPFVYDEVEISFGELMPESKQVFDCISEVLLETKDRYLSYSSPWTSIIRPNIRPVPKGENLVQEVWKRIDGHLCVQFPCTLDQLLRKDLDGGSWMNVLMETEGGVVEVGEVILDYIMEETILELWE